MNKRVIPTISVSLRPSYLILGCYVSVSILSMLALLLSQLPRMLLLFLILAVIIATIYAILQAVWLILPWSWTQVEVNHEGGIRVTNKRMQTYDVQLLGTSVNHRWLIVLHFKLSADHLSFNNTLLLTPWQAVDVNQYRKLRVWLKWGNLLNNHRVESFKP